MTILPPPNSLGAPQRYDTWRQGQGEAFLRAVDSDKRFVALTLSTGSGKSLIYMVAALATGRRVAVLTATKALENQLLHDFEEVGLRDIRGQTNYPCAILTGGNGVSPPRFSEAPPLRSSSPGEAPATYPSACDGRRGQAGWVGWSGRTRRRGRGMKQLIGMLEELNRRCGDWVIASGAKGVPLSPLWPAPYAQGSLFLGIPRVMLTSATVRPRTLSLLGIQSEEVEIEDCPSTFPVQNRLVTHIPTVRLNHRSSETDVLLWVMRMDQIIGRRLDRKGIIHTVSYDRARLILERSQYKDLMLTHRAGGVAYAVSQFKRAKAPSVLVSPSVTTGVDFPDDECRYQIIAKVPFPEVRSTLVRARTEADPEYGLYLAMQSVVQAAGRGVRSQTDWCETYIVDDMWTWFYGRNQGMAPRWFREAVRRSVVIPLPAPPSGKGNDH